MPLDGLALHAVCAEIAPLLIGGRVDRINQPERDEINLLIRSQGKNHQLIISANASQARLHLTSHSKSNPMVPPTFCMLLRKHLQSSRVLGIEQMQMERIVKMRFETLDDFGDVIERVLMVETMGRHSNIILLNDKDVIIDSAHRVNAEISRVRQLLPGLQYELPPAQEKADPLTADELSIAAALADAAGEPLAKTITAAWMGISPATAKQLAAICSSDEYPCVPGPDTIGFELLVKKLTGIFTLWQNGEFSPTLIRDALDAPSEFFLFRPVGFDGDRLTDYESISTLLDDFFLLRDRALRASQRKASLKHTLITHLERAERKAAGQQEQVGECANMEQWRLYGELLTASMHQLKSGQRTASVVNYYDPDAAEVEIPLDPQLTPAQNAQRYYKRYNKQKATVAQVSVQLAQTREDITYLEGQLDNLEKCETAQEISEIRSELEKEGYLRAVHTRNKNGKQPAKRASAPSVPYRYLSSDGTEILVGKNNVQNDRLTLHTALPDEMWLHVKDAPGSHVIIRKPESEVSPQLLLEAATLAAWYSRSRASGNVAVDFCPRRYVRKPSGAKPGMVIYDHQRTLFVTPTESDIAKLTLTE